MYNHLFDYTIPLRAIQEKLDKSQVFTDLFHSGIFLGIQSFKR
ncbi:hypothetical protein HOLDEFILI_01863 [Holdemania filiformis DSM 12042]|uniref:Uncharacterized protein n=1 Tax=Holdemania filiformis DSM 12042 TaxID=545696 RepID=B9Y7R8_9FIRM|nr:hypothetical protein HOLDEFILI_01863 [Holdemania filiformis DSM 12042]